MCQLGVLVTLSVGLDSAGELHEVRSTDILIRGHVPLSKVRDARGIGHVATVRHFTGQDSGGEIKRMIVDHWRSRPAIRRPDVQSILPLVVKAKAEEPELLQRPGVVVGVRQDVPDKHLVRVVGVHTPPTRPLARGRSRLAVSPATLISVTTALGFGRVKCPVGCPAQCPSAVRGPVRGATRPLDHDRGAPWIEQNPRSQGFREHHRDLPSCTTRGTG